MACRILINENGINIGVEDSDGNPSALFQQILSNPHITSFSKALDIYTELSGQEGTLVYRSEENTYQSYSEALKNTNIGNIEAGIEADGKFKELFSVNSDSNISNFNGLINNLIKSDLLTGETVLDTNGVKLYSVIGNSEYKKAVTSDSAYTTAKSSVGYNVKRNAAGDLYFNQEAIGTRAINTVNDQIEYVSQEQLDNKSYSQLKKDVADPIGVMAERAYLENNRAFGNTTPLEEITIIPENELQQKLKNLLQDLGVKTVSLESYSRRFDVARDAQALADISNQIVAFSEGNISQEDLSEETAHFIVEATDPTQIQDLLRNIHRTQEWNDNEAAYRELYSQRFAGQELETIVRKEILGKVLANSLQANFAARENSQTENTIISRLQALFNSFINSVQAFFKPAHKQQLESYSKSVYNNLMADGLYEELNSEQLKGKKFTLYSVGKSAEYQRLSNVLDNLTRQQYELAKRYSAPASQAKLRDAKESLTEAQAASRKAKDESIGEAIRNIEANIEQTAKLKALENIAEVANSQLNYLTRVLDDNTNKGYHFSQEENSVYQNYITKLEPLISQLTNQLNNKDRAEKRVKDRFTEALKKGVTLKGKVPANNETAINLIVDRVVAKNNLVGREEETFREQITKVLTAANKDTNWFHAHLGHLAHAQNPLLNLAGDIIAKQGTEARQTFLQQIKPFLNRLETIGFDPRNLKNLIDKDGYILHEIDNSKLAAIELADQVSVYNQAADSNIEEKDFKPELIDTLDADARNFYNKTLNNIKKARLESFFTAEHLEKLNNASIEVDGQKIFRSELPEIAQEYEQYYRGQLTAIRVNNGGINTASDRYEIEDLNKRRVQEANPRNRDGSIKNGLREINHPEYGYIVQLDPSTITSKEDREEAEKVYGLQMISLINRAFYSGQERATEIPQTFLDKLNEFETETEKWEFVRLNAYVGFKQDFWEGFGANESLLSRLDNQKDGENDSEIDEVAADIRKQQQIIANILKSNRVFNSPAETNVAEMSDIETGSVKDAAIQLENLYSKAKLFLPKEEQSTVEVEAQTRANEAFRKDLEDENIDTEEGVINFAVRHMTPNNANNVREAAKVLAKIRAGDSDVVIRKSLQRVFLEEMSEQEATEAFNAYLESKLLPYYKRTEPTGYTAAQEEFNQKIVANEQGTVENFIEENPYLDVSPSYSFYNSGEQINPKWQANKDAKRPQYTQEFLDKIKNQEYFTRYGLTQADGAPTQNVQEYQARQAILDLQDQTIENLGLTGRHNRYLLPQQRKSATRRLAGFLGSLDFSNIRQNINDIVNFREDEGEIGQNEDGELAVGGQELTIPAYGIHKIAEPSDVTDELLHSYAWMAQQAALTKARRENISNMLTIHDALLNADFVGKGSNATNAYKMLRSYLNSNYYDVRETFSYKIGKNIDLGKLAKVFNSWVRTTALTSFTVPFTSLWQAKIQRYIEGQVGEVTNPLALKLGRKEFHKYATSSALEVMNMNSKAKINILGESFGIFSAEQRYNNSNYNKAGRFVLGANSGLHALGNYPVIPTVLLSILNDYRYVNGNIVSFNQFLRQNQGVDRKELKTKWETYDLFYSDITTENGVQEYHRQKISEKLGIEGEELDNKLRLTHEAITTRVGAAVQRIDSQIEDSQKSLAARDSRANFFLMFLNWWILQVQYKTKAANYDISSDTFQEGTLITTGKFLKDLVVKRKDIKKVWNEALADPVKRRNLKRTLVEFGVANALAIVAISLSNYVDDDDDPAYPIAFLDYFVTRVASEQVSGTIALPRQIGQLIESPLPAADRFYDLFNITDLASDELVTRGTFAGHTKRYKWASQNLLLLKDYHRLSNIKQSQDVYEHFNSDVYDYAVLSWFFDDEEDAD